MFYLRHGTEILSFTVDAVDNAGQPCVKLPNSGFFCWYSKTSIYPASIYRGFDLPSMIFSPEFCESTYNCDKSDSIYRQFLPSSAR